MFLVGYNLQRSAGLCSDQLTWSLRDVKEDLSLSLRRESIWRTGGIAPFILNLGASWRRVVNLRPRPLYPGGKNSGTQSLGGWISLRAGVNL